MIHPTLLADLAVEYFSGAAQIGGSSVHFAHYQITRRNGAVVQFEPRKIAIAMAKAYLAVHGPRGVESATVRETVEQLTHKVVQALLESRPSGGNF